MKFFQNLISIVLLTIFLIPSVFAQKPPFKLGKIDSKLVKMKRYERDTTASAVVLADFGVSKITYNQNTGFQVEFDRSTRIKILTIEGLDWANISIPVYHSGSGRENVSRIKGYTYNLVDGKIKEEKLSKSEIFTEEVSDNWDVEKFTMPNVKVGSVIEYTYHITSDFFFNLREWEFQKTIPIVWSEYNVQIPEYFNYQKLSQGYFPLSVNEHNEVPKHISITSKRREGFNVSRTNYTTDKISYKENQFRFAAKDVPSFIEEPYITTSKNFITKITFELNYVKFPNQPLKQYRGTWDSFNKDFLEEEWFGLHLQKTGFLKDEIEALTAGKENDVDKMTAVFEFIRKQMEWDGRSNKYASGHLRKAFDEKKGSSAEINLMLTGALIRAGIKADPVLLSTRSHGYIIPNFPISKKFNYVICKAQIGDKYYLLDATDDYLPIGVLPYRCLNGQGRVISETNPGWVDLKPTETVSSIMQYDLQMDNDGSFSGDLTISSKGYPAYNFRKKIKRDGEDNFIEKLKEENESWAIEDYSFENLDDNSQPFNQKYQISASDITQKAGNIIFINPLLNEGMEENYFKLENRQYPVDYGYPFNEMYMVTIAIPEGFKVDEVPETTALVLPGNAAKFQYSVKVIGNKIQVLSNLSINKPIFLPEEYPNLRELYNIIVSKHSEQIVLKKST